MKKGFIFALVLGLVLAFYFYKKQQIPSDPRSQKIAAGADNSEYVVALVEAAQQQDPVAFRFALERADSPLSLHRQASASALGFFMQAKAGAILKKLATDSDQAVRQRAIVSLGQRNSPDRTEILTDLLQNKTQSLAEKIHISSAVLSAVQDKALREEAIQNLYQAISSSDSSLRSLAYDNLLNRVGAYPPVKDYVKNLFTKETDPFCLASVVRYYAPEKPVWILGWLEKQTEIKNPLLMLTVTQTLHQYCPKNRKVLLAQAQQFKGDQQIAWAVSHFAKFKNTCR